MEDAEDKFAPIGGRFRKRTAIYIVLFLFMVGFLVLWFSRISLAENFVSSELDRLDVEASYEIADIGFNKQVIRNLVLGDPENPDLTADLVEIGNTVGLSGAGIEWVNAENVKLFGKLVDGKISFGELDKFSDPENDSPLALPAIWLTLAGGQAQIVGDYGMVGLALNGSGHLLDGFEGELAVISEQLSFTGCTMQDPTFFGKISIEDKEPQLEGPLRMPALTCPDQKVSSEDMAAQVKIKLGEGFASWDGDIGLIGGPVRYADYSAQELRTSLDFSGDMKASEGSIDLAASGLLSPYGGANMLRANGPVSVAYGDEVLSAKFEGQPEIRSMRLSQSLTSRLGSLAKSTETTPVGPLTKKLAAAVINAGRDIDIKSDLRIESGFPEQICCSKRWMYRPSQVLQRN